MGFDWGMFAAKLPGLIQSSVRIVKHVKAAGTEKKAGVIDAIIQEVPAGIAIAEGASGRDLLNDDHVQQLLGAAVDAEAAAMKAHDALQAGLLAKAPASATP